jgi:hypothetical protein
VTTDGLLPGNVDGFVFGAVLPIDAWSLAGGEPAGEPLAPETWDFAGPLALTAGILVGWVPADLVGPWDACAGILVGCALVGCALVGCALIGCAFAGAGPVAVGCPLLFGSRPFLTLPVAAFTDPVDGVAGCTATATGACDVVPAVVGPGDLEVVGVLAWELRDAPGLELASAAVARRPEAVSAVVPPDAGAGRAGVVT